MELKPLKEKPEYIIDILKYKLIEKFGSKLLMIGAKGSIATNKFTPYSDIDLVVIISEGKNENIDFFYNTTYITIEISTLKSILNTIKDVDLYWSIKVGGILNIKPYYDSKNTIKKIRTEFEKITKNDSKFIKAIHIGTFVEYYSKALRAFENKEFKHLNWISLELLHHFAFIMALLNKAYFIRQGPEYFLEDIKKFKFKPRDCEKSIQMTLNNNPKIKMLGIEKMYNIITKLNNKYNFQPDKFKKIEDITIKWN